MPIKDKWDNDVCMQTTHSTCGPASLATIFASSGIPVTERNVAIGSYNAVSGTEIWYLIRYARKYGMNANITVKKNLSQISSPAILGTVIAGSCGHVIALLEKKQNGKFIIGDSMVGRLELTQNEFDRHYGFNGFAVEFVRR